MFNRLREVKRKSQDEMLDELGKTFCRYLIQATPPFGQHPFAPNNWQEQKAIGQAGVRRDFKAAFTPLTHAAFREMIKNAGPRARRYLYRYFDSRNVHAINRMLRNLKATNVNLIKEVTPSLARDNVFFKARPHHIKRRYLVVDRMSLKRELKRALDHVGTAKAGWLLAADALGVRGLPVWIRRQQGRALGYIEKHSGPSGAFLRLVNLTEGCAGVNHDVAAAASRQLRFSMARQMEAILGKHLKKRK